MSKTNDLDKPKSPTDKHPIKEPSENFPDKPDQSDKHKEYV